MGGKAIQLGNSEKIINLESPLISHIGIISKQTNDVKARGRRKRRRSTIIISILEERRGKFLDNLKVRKTFVTIQKKNPKYINEKVEKFNYKNIESAFFAFMAKIKPIP